MTRVLVVFTIFNILILSNASPVTFHYVPGPASSRSFIQSSSIFDNSPLDSADLEAAESAQYGYNSFGRNFGRNGRSLGFSSGLGFNSLGSLNHGLGHLNSGFGHLRGLSSLGVGSGGGGLRSFNHLSSLGGGFGQFGGLGGLSGFRGFRG